MALPNILYDDETMIAFDKPCGLSVAPDRPGKHPETLMELVHAKWGKAIASVHRLDTDTSGILLCAKTKPALDFLSGQFQSKTAGRTSLALVALLPPERQLKMTAPVVMREPDGTLPASFTVDLPLGEDEHQAGRMRIVRGHKGKSAVTAFTVLERFGDFALVQCRPQTGRPHQIRLHLAAAGAPVLNDPLYGDENAKLMLSDLKRGYKGRDDEKPLISRLALHAGELVVKHPATREPVTLTAPLPKEFEVALKYLRKFASGKPRAKPPTMA